MGNQIHWFPGHMNKALKEIEEKIKIVDVVIEILDARIPFSSVNNEFENIVKNKKKLIVLSKEDLADPIQINKIKNEFSSKGINYVIGNITSNDIANKIIKQISILGEEKHAKEKAKGLKPQPLKTMIIGIPNVGKSSLINKLAKRKAAGVENRPGFTRGEQLIKVNNDFLLLDTPGVLPMNYEDKKKAVNLALVGSIKENILPLIDLSNELLSFLKEHYPSCLSNRFGIDTINDFSTVYLQIATKRGLLRPNNEFDMERVCQILLKEFKDGKLGRISLDWIK